MSNYVIYGLLLMTTVASVQSAQSPSEPCKDGETTSFDNGCNTCFCANGNWACTLKFCFNGDLIRTKRKLAEDEPACKDGDQTSFDNGCNTCVCGNGNWACTLKLCPELEAGLAKREASPPKECAPHDTKQEACNSCWCTETGIWICTKKACPKQKREAIAAGFESIRRRRSN